MNFEIGDRPERKSYLRKTDATILKALEQTTTSKTALYVPLPEGETWHRLYNRYRTAARRQGLSLRARTGPKGELVMWAEEVE